MNSPVKRRVVISRHSGLVFLLFIAVAVSAPLIIATNWMNERQVGLTVEGVTVLGAIVVALLIGEIGFQILRSIERAVERGLASMFRRLRSLPPLTLLVSCAAIVAFGCLWVATSERHEVPSRGQWALLGITSALIGLGFASRMRNQNQ